MDIAEFEGIPHSKVPEDFRLEAGQEACSLAMINNVLVGEIFGSGTAVNAPGLHSHVAIHDGLLPGICLVRGVWVMLHVCHSNLNAVHHIQIQEVQTMGV